MKKTHVLKLSGLLFFSLLVSSSLIIVQSFPSTLPYQNEGLVPPDIVTSKATHITTTTAVLHGQLIDDGGGPCTLWFSWDDYPLDNECAGLIATGSVVTDNRSIFWKNRHFSANYQKPRFYQGDVYSYIGIGHADGICRMGINEKGLAIGNFDIHGTVDPDKRWFYSDQATGSEDGDMHYVLGNFSTVAEAAIALAKHGTFPSQLGIVSNEEGVGAIVTIGVDRWTNVTWVNNTWIALGNAMQCNGHTDVKMRRIQRIIRDIQENKTSVANDDRIHWRDVAQRLARDIDSGHGLPSEPYGTEGTYFASGINPSTARSAMIAVSGNSSYDGAFNLIWAAFGQTTHLSLFVPLAASYVNSAEDIPIEFTQGNGLEAYTQVKKLYAEASPNRYYRSRVHEIHRYMFHNENLTFDEYDVLMQTSMTCADAAEAQARLQLFADSTMRKALEAYEANSTFYATNSTVFSLSDQCVMSGTSLRLVLRDLLPGTVYYYKACARNKEYEAHGSQQQFMTKPGPPTNITIRPAPSLAFTYLSWSKGSGAHHTVIERNSIPVWSRGTGVVVYNGSATQFTDFLTTDSAQPWYYQLWSYTAAEGLYQYSDSTALSLAESFSSAFTFNTTRHTKEFF